MGWGAVGDIVGGLIGIGIGCADNAYELNNGYTGATDRVIAECARGVIDGSTSYAGQIISHYWP